jgi:ABC-type enterobactin transport system permease subunit
MYDSFGFVPDDSPPATNKSIIIIVVVTLAANATVIVGSICFCLLTGKEVNQTLLNSALSMGNFLLGAVAGMLTKTSPTETTKQVSVSNQPVVVPAEPTEIKA